MQGQIGVMVAHAIASQQDPEEIYKTGLHATPLLESLAEVIIGWLLIRHAGIAFDAIDGADEDDRAFYEGKIASARWFAATVLPDAALRRARAEAEDGALMELPIEAF